MESVLSEMPNCHTPSTRIDGGLSGRKRLYLFTDGFPFGKGEKSFIIPELDALKKEYKITVVAEVSEAIRNDRAHITPLDDDIDVLVAPLSLSFPRALIFVPYVLSFFCSSLGRSELRSLFEDGFTMGRLLDSIKQFALAKHLWRFCNKNNVFNDSESAIYYSFWFSTRALALALEKQKHPSIVVVSRVHGYELYNEVNPNRRQPFQRIKRDAMTRLLFVSAASMDYFRKAFGPERFSGQYCLNRLGVGAGSPVFDRPRGNARYVVSCSNVIPVKRVELIAQAFELLKGLNVTWIHFGDGDGLVSIKEFVKEHAIPAEFAGHIRNEDICEFYREHRVACFVQASSSEGLPVSIQEALAAGVPIVATDVGGVSETIDGNGVLLPSNPTPEEIAAAIKRICIAPESEWKRLSARSFTLWKERFDVGANKNALLRELRLTNDASDGFDWKA